MKIAGIDPAALSTPSSPLGGGLGSLGGAGGFDEHVRAAMAELEQSAIAADETAEGMVTGEVDIHEAMVAMEKADLTLRVAGTVRTKVIEAYQQLMQVAGS